MKLGPVKLGQARTTKQEDKQKTSKKAITRMFAMLYDVGLELSRWVGFLVIVAFQLFFGYLSLYFAYEFAKILEKRDKTCFSVEVVVQSCFLMS